MLVNRGKKAGTRPGTVGSSSPAAAGERWTSERQSSDQGALFKEATSELRAGVRRRHRMAGLRKGLLEEEEAPRLPACPHSRGHVLTGAGFSQGRVHGGASSREGRVLTGGGVLTGRGRGRGRGGGRVLTWPGPHGRGASSRRAESSLGRVLSGARPHHVSAAQGGGTLTPRDYSLSLPLPTCFLFPSSLSFLAR